MVHLVIYHIYTTHHTYNILDIKWMLSAPLSRLILKQCIFSCLWFERGQGGGENFVTHIHTCNYYGTLIFIYYYITKLTTKNILSFSFALCTSFVSLLRIVISILNILVWRLWMSPSTSAGLSADGSIQNRTKYLYRYNVNILFGSRL